MGRPRKPKSYTFGSCNSETCRLNRMFHDSPDHPCRNPFSGQDLVASITPGVPYTLPFTGGPLRGYLVELFGTLGGKLGFRPSLRPARISRYIVENATFTDGAFMQVLPLVTWRRQIEIYKIG